MPNVFYPGLDVFDVAMVAMCCLPCLKLQSVVCQYHLLLAHDDTFVCQLIDELQLVRDWSCETSLVLFLMSVIKPSDSSIPRLFCEAWDG
jgi:hypothetical protein